MNPNFYVEIDADYYDMSDSSDSDSETKCCQPLDLSRRGSVETEKALSVYSDARSCSPLESSSSTSTHQDHIAHSSHSKPPRDISPSRDSPSPDFAFLGPENGRFSTSTIEAAALQRSFGAQPAKDYSSENDSSNGHNDERAEKFKRPFKTYPKISFDAVQSVEKFKQYRQQKLNELILERGGQQIKTNPKMRRNTRSLKRDKIVVSDDATATNSTAVKNSNSAIRDISYYKLREKNNAAAKKSRDRRRMKEDEIAIKAAYLEKENHEYQVDLAAAKKELEALKHELAFVRSQLLAHVGKHCAAVPE